MKKTYKSFGKGTVLVVTLESGERRTIEFKRDIVEPKRQVWGSSYSTDDEELQKAIESHKYYGSGAIFSEEKVVKRKKR